MKSINEKIKNNSSAEKEFSRNDITLNGLAENKNGEIENQIQRIFRQSPFTIALIEGENFIFRMVNVKAAEVIGKTETEIVGKSVFELMPELKINGFHEILLGVLKTAKPFVGVELPASYKKNGQLITAYFDLVYEPYYDPSGKITGIISSGVDVTEKVLARKKIEESEEQLKLITDSLPVLITYIDKSRRYRFNNKAYETWFGHSSKEIYGKHLMDVLGEAAYMKLKPKIDDVLMGKPVHFEMPVPYKDGGVKWVVADYIPHFGKDNEVLGYYGVVNDVSTLMKAEELNFQLAAIVQSSEDAIVSKTLDGIVTSWNQSAEKIFGYTEEEMVGQHITKIIPEQRLQEEQVIIENILQGKIVAHFETQRINKEGKLLDISLTISPIKDRGGKIIGASKIARNITEQIKARKKIEESEIKYRHLVLGLPVAVYTCDAEGRILLYNEAAVQLWGRIPKIGKDEWCGSWKIYKTDGTPLPLEECPLAIALKEGRIVQFEIIVERPDGSRRNVMPHPQPFFDSYGKITGATNTLLDITESREAEDAIKIRSLEFESAVKERTKELNQANEALQQANQQIAISKYNQRFLTEFSEKFSTYKAHEEFFNSLMLYIADLTKIDYVLIGKLEEKSKNEFTIQTIAITAFGKLVDNINYPLPHGPCEQVIRGKLYSYPEKCRVTFPKNQTLVQFNVEGYIGYPLFDTKGNAVGLMAVMHETKIADPDTVTSILKITSKRAEVELERIQYEIQLEKNNKILAEKNQTLAESENKIQTIFEAAPDAVITIDHNGIISNWNEEAENIFGWQKNEVIGRTLSEIIIPPRYREQHKNGLKNFLRTGQGKVIGKPIEIEALKKDSTEIPVELKISASSVNNSPPVFIGFVRDISQRKQAENALNRKNIELIEVNANLEKMNKELESFTYVSSHDLQEPLRKIQTFAGRIAETESQNLSDKGKDYFHRMQEASHRMQTLIQDLLAFSRLNSAESKFETTDLNKIVEEVKTDFKEIIEEKQASIVTNELCEPALIIPFQFRQLMQNLIGNALKFSKPQTPPRILIRSDKVKYDKPPIKNLLSQKEYCHISIQDNGIGFEIYFSEKIFEVFQRLHDKEKYSGTGIGLAIVKKIVDNHNGIITATSELGKGATFDIYIPA